MGGAARRAGARPRAEALERLRTALRRQLVEKHVELAEERVARRRIRLRVNGPTAVATVVGVGILGRAAEPPLAASIADVEREHVWQPPGSEQDPLEVVP